MKNEKLSEAHRQNGIVEGLIHLDFVSLAQSIQVNWVKIEQ